MNESGFRSYCREHVAGFTLLEPVQTFEDRAIARDVTEQLLHREPALAGLYVSGGGIAGVLEALDQPEALEFPQLATDRRMVTSGLSRQFRHPDRAKMPDTGLPR